MSIKNHPHYNEEKSRLDFTIDYVEASIIATNKNRKRFKADMREAYIDLDPTDSSLSYVKIMTNAKFLDTLDKNYHNLIRARKNPYFCRIDFQIKGTKEPSKLYIGKMSLAKANDHSLIIIDWRSPIATVYYDGRIGDVSYKSPEGLTKGELFLKRQYSINNKILENIMDVDITTTDTFLQNALGENKDNKLKDIVSTIQSEQNEIIRADIGNPIIVQGAAGSGKTTIALHRIAYLIYTYEKTFYPSNFLIIAPNNLFLDYISGVLPDLGVDKVIQSTFEEIVKTLTNTKFKLIDSDKKLIKIIENKYSNKELDLIQKQSKFKGSIDFCKYIDDFINVIEKSFIPEEDFLVGEYKMLSYYKINKLFKEELNYLSVYKRLPELKKTLSNTLKSKKKLILENIETSYDKKIDYIRNTTEESDDRRIILTKLIDERDFKMESFKKFSKTAVRKYLNYFKEKHIDLHYKDFIKYLINLNSENDILKALAKSTLINLDKNQIEIEDLTPILYLKNKLYPMETKLDIKYIVVDEAQDFSPLQIFVLKKIFNTELFTLLGDISQGIHSYRGINSWSEIFDNVFENKFKKFLTLEQSYRTTIEIMNVANEVIQKANIPQIVLAKPVVRHGIKPNVFSFNESNTLINKLIETIKNLLSDKFKSIAIICKTNNECIKLKNLITQDIKVPISHLKASDSKYDGGIVILPAYLSKGLEFDVVLLTLYNNHFFENELDIKLLYVSITRALHILNILKLTKNDTIISSLKEVNHNI